jgi:DnaJ family protein B protein 12
LKQIPGEINFKTTKFPWNCLILHIPFKFGTNLGNGFPFGAHPQSQFFFNNMTRPERHYRQRSQATEQGFSWLQIFPVLLLIFLSLMNSFISGPTLPDYSFKHTAFFSDKIETRNHHFEFFVNHDEWLNFRRHHSGYVSSFLDSVESNYVSKLADKCKQEQVLRQRAIDRVYGWGFQRPSPEELKKATERKMPSCEQLNKLGYRVS